MSDLLALLRRPHALRVLVAALVGRLPEAMVTLAVVLVARAEGGSYAAAGTLAGAYAVGAAIGGPALGRVVDRLGQPLVILLSTAGRTVALLGVAALAGRSLAAAGVCVAAAGAMTPPLEPALRALWPDLTGDEAQLHAAYELDAGTQELVFVIGPLVVATVGALTAPVWALHATWAVGVVGAVAFAAAPPARRWQPSGRSAAHWLAAVRAPEIARLLTVGLLIGIALGAVTVATTAFAEFHGRRADAGWLLALWSLGGLAAGLFAASRRWETSAELRLQRLLVVFAVSFAPTLVLPSLGLMGAAMALAGAALAPTLGCVFVLTGARANAGAVTETFAWLTSAILVGSALGSAAAGALSGGAPGGSHAGYASAAVALLGAAAVWRLRPAARR